MYYSYGPAAPGRIIGTQAVHIHNAGLNIRIAIMTAVLRLWLAALVFIIKEQLIAPGTLRQKSGNVLVCTCETG